MNNFVTITDQKAVTTSLIVAEAFEKRHDNVMRSIERLECSKEFTALNFEGSSYMDSTGRMLPMYTITRDGFTFLAMGFTGKRAAEFKEKFIAAFNAMEKALLEDSGDHRRVDVNMNHVRGITNPHGLDVKYTFDLTKIALKPTQAGIDILERITGIDMSDIDLGRKEQTECDLTGWLAGFHPQPGGKRLLKDLYTNFCTWHRAVYPDKNMPLPSRKWLAARIRQETSYAVTNRCGNVYVFGIAEGPT